jgi:hypothetical protein
LHWETGIDTSEYQISRFSDASHLASFVLRELNKEPPIKKMRGR